MKEKQRPMGQRQNQVAQLKLGMSPMIQKHYQNLQAWQHKIEVRCDSSSNDQIVSMYVRTVAKFERTSRIKLMLIKKRR